MGGVRVFRAVYVAPFLRLLGVKSKTCNGRCVRLADEQKRDVLAWTRTRRARRDGLEPHLVIDHVDALFRKKLNNTSNLVVTPWILLLADIDPILTPGVRVRTLGGANGKPDTAGVDRLDSLVGIRRYVLRPTSGYDQQAKSENNVS
jgi:hypothetical protein